MIRLWLPVAVLGALLCGSTADAQYIFPNRYPSPNDPVLAPPSGNGWNYSDYQRAVYGGYVMRFPPEATTHYYRSQVYFGYTTSQPAMWRQEVLRTSDIVPTAYGEAAVVQVRFAPDILSLYRADAVLPINPGYVYPGTPVVPVTTVPSSSYTMPKVQ